MVAAQDVVKFQNMVSLIEEQSEGLKGYIGSLSPEALEPPSPCALWTVGDVVGHLVWFAETYGGMMERGLRGDTSPLPGYPAPGTLSRQASEEMYAQAAIERRRELGRELPAAFAQRYDHLNSVLRSIGPEDWDKPCYHLIRIRTVHSFLPTIIQELAIHECDIRSSLEPGAGLAESCLPVLMEDKIPTNRRPWSLPFPARPAATGQVRYRFQLAGPAGGSYDVVVEGATARLEAAGEGPADIDLQGSTETFALLMFGRLSLGSAISAGRLTATGDRALVPDFDRWLAAH